MGIECSEAELFQKLVKIGDGVALWGKEDGLVTHTTELAAACQEGGQTRQVWSGEGDALAVKVCHHVCEELPGGVEALHEDLEMIDHMKEGRAEEEWGDITW